MFKLINIFFFDLPFLGQILMQTPATPIMEGIIECFMETGFINVFICLIVFWVSGRVIIFHYDDIFNYFRPMDNRIDLPLLEFIWTLIPIAILLTIIGPAFALVYGINHKITPDVTIKIIGRQWYWTYETILSSYESTFDSVLLDPDEPTAWSLSYYRLLDVSDPLYLPMNVGIRLLITSSDVLHSFAVPSLGIKVDACPGRLNQVLLYINRPGTFFGQCSEICGVNHGFMPIVVKVVPYNVFISKLVLGE